MKKLLFTLALTIPALTFAQQVYQPTDVIQNLNVYVALEYDNLETWYSNELYNLLLSTNPGCVGTITHQQFTTRFNQLNDEYKRRKKVLKKLETSRLKN